MRHVPECWHCEKKRNAGVNVRYCAICDGVIPKGRSHSQYCSLECSRAIAEARAGIGNAIARHVRTGVLVPAKELTCVDCGSLAREYEHREYLKPFDVVPVCHACNLKRGPAIDVKEAVAMHLGIDVQEIPHAISRKREELRKWRVSMLSRHTTKAGTGDTASAKEAA